MNPIKDILFNPRQSGIYSCCSANRFVLMAAISRALDKGTHLLVEATANQVDQFGGYTGLTPADFREYVLSLALEAGLPVSRVILGGDHLGPLTWSHLPAEKAMENACDLIDAYVSAGFSKIHLDTSMRLGDDDIHLRLADDIIAERSARLCAVSEAAYTQLKNRVPDAPAPVYIIGSEVPIPGGAQHEMDAIAVTDPQDCRNTIETFRKIFARHGLENAWNRVIGIVVQPGIEFNDTAVFEYNREGAKPLLDVLKDYPQFVFEGHSTDYQRSELLHNMVMDGIRILKVGPALTLALREALFSLEMIEREIVTDAPLSHFRDALEIAMLDAPGQWKKHYHGNETALRLARAFSFSDRSRYYLNTNIVESSIERLLHNIDSHTIPLTLLSQFMPNEYQKVREGLLSNNASALIKEHIGCRIDDYLNAINL